jgi:hypothetical protein
MGSLVTTTKSPCVDVLGAAWAQQHRERGTYGDKHHTTHNQENRQCLLPLAVIRSHARETQSVLPAPTQIRLRIGRVVPVH